jgi:pSer/pThr/pTyr-binding forkhead associated (FHA) protein
MSERKKTIASSLRMWLVFDPGQPTQRVVEARGTRVVIGRDDDCDVVLDDPAVSGHHAAISVRRGAAPTIEDLGSANGTFVNGRPVTVPVGFIATQRPGADVHGGDWIRIGDSIAVVSLVPPPPSMTDPRGGDEALGGER